MLAAGTVGRIKTLDLAHLQHAAVSASKLDQGIGLRDRRGARFLHPHVDAVLEVLPPCRSDADPPPVRAQDFLMERLRAIGVAS